MVVLLLFVGVCGVAISSIGVGVVVVVDVVISDDMCGVVIAVVAMRCYCCYHS